MIAKAYHLGLIGYPLGHSRSPQLHHAALEAAGLQGEYRLYAIPPTEAGTRQIALLVQSLRAGELDGLNVTIPHKTTVIPWVDRLSETARAVGAVNTLYRDAHSRVIGENTDVPGFLRDVQRITGADRGQALVLGAGGSARAVVYALISAGWSVQVAARRLEQAEELIKGVSDGNRIRSMVSAHILQREFLSKARCDLLVNTTPVGMYPDENGCPWPEDIPLPPAASVYDLIYNPEETRLVKKAREEGKRACSGAGMLVAQAALAFQHWTGLDAPYGVMEQAFYRPVGKGVGEI